VEHVEVDDRWVHNIYKTLVNSGLAFGARRWVGTLSRQCERLASAMTSNIPNGERLGGTYAAVPIALLHLMHKADPHKYAYAVITSVEGRKNMLKLAERIVANFYGGMTASLVHQWTTLSGSGAEDVRIMVRMTVDDPGRPSGIALNVATSFWLPVTPTTVFDFLRDETSRSQVRHITDCCFLCH
jgi:homeobox-leucine zipper protein